MTWLGLDWQEGPNKSGEYGPYRQSERFDIYNKVIDQLLAEGKAYRCTATSEELDELRAGQRLRGEKMMYDNRYRDANLQEDCGPHVIRLKTPLTGETIVNDKIKGECVFQNKELDDFIIRRTDGAPTYNFVVVIDDIAMKMSLVLRGDDHLNNSPKQINLYDALGTEPPAFAHVPMILGTDGKRLSKRHGAVAVGEYYRRGILKEALFNYLARLGWACGDMEIFTPQEMIDVFSLSQINKAGAKWDKDKLLWVNQQWIMRLDLEDLAKRSRHFIAKKGIDLDESRYIYCVGTLQERAQTLLELADKIEFYFVGDTELYFDPEMVAKALQARNATILGRFADFLNTQDDWQEEILEIAAKEWVKEYSTEVRAAGGKKVKMGQLLFPTRIALCGVGGGPGVFEVMQGLGKDKTIRRLELASEKCLQAE